MKEYSMDSRDPDFPHEEYAMIVGATAPGTTRRFHNIKTTAMIANSHNNSSTKYFDILMADIMCDARPSGVVLPKILRSKVTILDNGDDISKIQSKNLGGEGDGQNHRMEQQVDSTVGDPFKVRGLMKGKPNQYQTGSRVNVDAGSIQQQSSSSLLQQHISNSELDNLTLLERVSRYDDVQRFQTSSYCTQLNNGRNRDGKDYDGGEKNEDMDAFIPDNYEPPPSYAKTTLDPSVVFTTSEIERKLSEANAALHEIHKQLYRGEELYFQDTDHHGNLYKGWDSLVDSKADHLGIGFAKLDGDGNSGGSGGVMLDRILGDHSRMNVGGIGTVSGNGNKSSINQGNNGPSQPTRRMPVDYRWFSSSSYSTARDRGSNAGKTIPERKRSGSRRSNINCLSNAGSTVSSAPVIPTVPSGRIATPSIVAGISIDGDTVVEVVAIDADVPTKESSSKRVDVKDINAAQLMPPPMSTSPKKVNETQLASQSQSLSLSLLSDSTEGGGRKFVHTNKTILLKDRSIKSSITQEMKSITSADDNSGGKTFKLEPYTVIPKKKPIGATSSVMESNGGTEKDTNYGSIRLNEKYKRNRKEKKEIGKLTTETTIEKKRENPKKSDDQRDSNSSESVKKKAINNNAPKNFISSFDVQNVTTKDAIETKKSATNVASILSQDIPRKKRRIDQNQSNINHNISSGGMSRSVIQAGGGVGNGMIPKKSSGDYSERSVIREAGIESDRKRKKDHSTTSTNVKLFKKKDTSKASFGSDYATSKWGNKSSDRRRYDSDQLRKIDAGKISAVSGNNLHKKGHKGSESEINKKVHKGSDRKHKRDVSQDDSKSVRKVDGLKLPGSGCTGNNKVGGSKGKSRKQKNTEV